MGYPPIMAMFEGKMLINDQNQYYPIFSQTQMGMAQKLRLLMLVFKAVNSPTVVGGHPSNVERFNC